MKYLLVCSLVTHHYHKILNSVIKELLNGNLVTIKSFLILTHSSVTIYIQVSLVGKFKQYL